MSVQTTCPHCGQRLNIRDELANKRVRCSKCQQVFEAVPASAAPTPAVAKSAAAAKPREHVTEKPSPPPVPARTKDDGDDEVERRPARDDREQRRPKKKKSGGIPPAYIIGGGVAAAVLIGLLAVGLMLASFAFSARPKAAPAGGGADDLIAVLPKGNQDPNDRLRPEIPAERPPLPPAAKLKLTDVRTIDVQARGLAYDRVRGHLLAAVPAAAPKYADTVAAFDPATGELVWSAVVGNDPAVLALSDDAKVLWVGLSGASGLRRVDLDKREAGPMQLIDDETFAECIVVIPGTTDTIAVSLYEKNRSPRHKGVVVLDEGEPRKVRTPGHTGSNRIVATDQPAVLFGYNNETTDFGLRRMQIDERGIRVDKNIQEVLFGFGHDIAYANGRIFGGMGVVVDVKTRKVAGKVPASGGVATDPDAKRAYYYDGERKALEAYDTETLAKQGSYAVGQNYAYAGSLTPLAGAGVAYKTENQIVVVPADVFK